MATVRVVIRKRKNKQGLHPIIIRISHNRKSSIISTGQVVDEKYWDADKQRVRKSHPNATYLNNYILHKLAEANKKVLQLQTTEDQVTAQVVTKNIKSSKNVTTFFELADTYLKQLESKEQFNRLISEKPRIKHFKDFLKGSDITFPEITETLLRQYETYLTKDVGNSKRTVANNYIVIRTIYNYAIREGIVDRKFYPFGKNGITIRFPQSVKIGLSSEEVKLLESVELDVQAQHHSRNVWLFSFYFAGMRVSDVLKVKWSDFKDGRLYYQMGKNNKVLSLKVPDKVTNILKEYESDKKSDDDFIFPEMKKADLSDTNDVRRKVANGTKVLNKHLGRVAKKIELKKPLTMHIARHTFGNISGDHIPVQVLQKLYRHSDITTTINYQKNFAHKQVDDALDMVINS